MTRAAFRPDTAFCSVTPAEGVIRAGDRTALDVAITPTQPAKFDGTFAVKVIGGPTLTVIASGRARDSTVAINRKRIQFAPVAPGATACESFTIANKGESDAEVSERSLPNMS